MVEERSPELSRVEMSARGGCQCKVGGLDVVEMIERAVELAARRGVEVKRPAYPEDCAAVETDSPRLLLTTELTPIVGRDLYSSGRIAALHAMSDVYASGGIPKWALVNQVVDPQQPREYGAIVLSGIMAQCAMEGAAVVGGHTIVGLEAMAGLTVIGQPRTALTIRKKGARPGDTLLLSKALGVGLIMRAYKLALLDDTALAAAESTMLVSNAGASAVALEAGVRAATDVTGFGMLGHLAEMLQPDLGAVIELAAVPALRDAVGLPGQVVRTDWIRNNYDYAFFQCPISGVTALEQLSVLLDPQTNGGLLVSAPKEAESMLVARGYSVVGRVVDKPGISIR